MFHGLHTRRWVTITEFPTHGGFLWLWEANPVADNDFVMTDMHSGIIFGAFLIDHLDLNIVRSGFLDQCEILLQRLGESSDTRKHMLHYFLTRYPDATKGLLEGLSYRSKENSRLMII